VTDSACFTDTPKRNAETLLEMSVHYTSERQLRDSAGNRETRPSSQAHMFCYVVTVIRQEGGKGDKCKEVMRFMRYK
jgi:hypothetical protein